MKIFEDSEILNAEKVSGASKAWGYPGVLASSEVFNAGRLKIRQDDLGLYYALVLAALKALPDRILEDV